jgi:hypothetical protein
VKCPGSLRDHPDERDIADLIIAYREDTTAASLAVAHGLNLKSVKRLLHITGVRQTPPTRRATKATRDRDAFLADHARYSPHTAERADSGRSDRDDCPATVLRGCGGDKRTVIELDVDKIGA